MRNYFNFSKSQKIGVLALAVIIIIQIVILNKNNGLGIPDPFLVNKSQYQQIENSNDYYKKYNNKKKPKHKLTNFDPNSYTNKQWEGIGFSEKQSKIIVNYKNKIGGFKKSADLEKVFVINEKKYQELKPFIQIIETNIPKKDIEKYTVKEKIPLVSVELNSATIQSLTTVKGIGEFTAKGILKRRQQIGGFHSNYQLKEVYGIENDNYERIITQITIDKSNIIKVNVNQLSIFELKKHPYISWNTAESIINNRLLGPLNELGFLVTDSIISKKELNTLLPYVTF